MTVRRQVVQWRRRERASHVAEQAADQTADSGSGKEASRSSAAGTSGAGQRSSGRIGESTKIGKSRKRSIGGRQVPAKHESWGTLRAEQRHTLWASVGRTMRAGALLSAHLVLAPTRTFEAVPGWTPADVTLLAYSKLCPAQLAPRRARGRPLCSAVPVPLPPLLLCLITLLLQR